MKKWVMTAGVVGLVVSAAVAADPVASENIVGYTKDVASAAGYHIAAMQFDAATRTPTALYGTQLPKGSKIYSFNGLNYDIATYDSVFVPGTGGLVTKWNAAFNLDLGKSYWVQVPSVATAILSGEVPMDESMQKAISVGFQMLSYPYPVARTITTLGLSPARGDKIYIFNTTKGSYDIATYDSVFVPGQGLVTKWNVDYAIGVGQGFWYQATAAQTWTVNRPFNP